MEQGKYHQRGGRQPMKIAVCMKQVPASSEGNMDPETGVLIRTGLEAVVNVYDLAALEAALRLKETYGAKIHVFTMGPEKAERVLREAFAMGADEGFLICDKAFAGADVLATSYTLKQAIESVGSYDLILCGRQTTDGDTAQVSGALAKWMDTAHVSWASEITDISQHAVKVRYNMDDRMIGAQVQLPCVISVEKDAFIPRMPSLKLKISGRKKEIHTLSLRDFPDRDEEHYGLKGSATRVRKIFPPERTKRQELVSLDGEKAAEYILKILDSDVQEERI